MEAVQAVEKLKALAQETRLEIFRLLVQAGENGLTPSDIQNWVEIPGPTLTFHMERLVKSGLCTTWKEGRYVVYAAKMEDMGGLISFLTDSCAADSNVKQFQVNAA